jgi:hypothetical protein
MVYFRPISVIQFMHCDIFHKMGYFPKEAATEHERARDMQLDLLTFLMDR